MLCQSFFIFSCFLFSSATQRHFLELCAPKKRRARLNVRAPVVRSRRCRRRPASSGTPRARRSRSAGAIRAVRCVNHMGFFSFLCKLDFNACLPPEDSAFTDPPGLCDEVKCAIETGSGLVAGSCGKLRGACESFKKLITKVMKNRRSQLISKWLIS